MSRCDRRTLIFGAGTLGACGLLACSANSGAADDNAIELTLFTDIAKRSIPGSIDYIRTRGFSRPGWGAATYRRERGLDADYCRRHPFTAAMVADGAVFRLWEPRSARPSQFGAAAVNGQDDTEMLQAFFRYPSALLQGDEGAVYLVRPYAADSVILPIERGIVCDGRGATIRLMDGSGDWSALLGNLDVQVDLSGTRLSNWIIDGNAAGSPPPDITNGLLRYPRHVICIRRGTGFRLQRCAVRNLVSTNAVLFSGDGATHDAIVEDCRFEAIGEAPSEVYHDHSTLYLTGNNIHVRKCHFQATKWGAAGAVCAIELHPGTGYSIKDCEVYGFHTGLNIAGIYEASSVNGVVSNNKIDALRRGIAIYSAVYRNHRIGFGIDGLLIDSNMIRIHNDRLRGRMTGGGIGVIGIGIISGATLPIRGIVMGPGNRIMFSSNDRDFDWEGIPVGVGFLEDHTDTRFEECQIEALTIINAPAIALALGLGRGVFRNISARPNIINCGITQAKHINDLHRTAIFSSSYRLDGNLTLTPLITDNLSHRAIVNGFVLNTQDTSCAIVRIAGKIQISSNIYGYGDTFAIFSRRIVPHINFVQNFAFYSTRPVLAKPGSLIRNISGKIIYRF